MSDMFKQALPYVLMALMALWTLSLQREVGQLEQANAVLTESFDTLAKTTESNDKAVVRWVESHDAEIERMGRLHEELDKVDDPHWGDVRLPSEYMRVLHEAGILDSGCDASVHPAEGGGNSEAPGNDESRSPGVCARR